jgi:hypothetical protein
MTIVPILFWNGTKTFWYRSRICLVENRLFWLGPESAIQDQIERISLDGAGSGTNSNFFVSFLLDVGMFVKRFWKVCSFTVLTLLLKPSSGQHFTQPKLLLSFEAVHQSSQVSYLVYQDVKKVVRVSVATGAGHQLYNGNIFKGYLARLPLPPSLPLPSPCVSPIHTVLLTVRWVNSLWIVPPTLPTTPF